MNDKLKQFVRRYRREFNDSEPGQDLWNKIEAQMEIKPVSEISSRWLSAFKYLGFGLSMLVVVLYFVAEKPVRPSESKPAWKENDLVAHNAALLVARSDNKPLNEDNATNVPSGNKNRSQRSMPVNAEHSENSMQATHNYLPEIIKKDSVPAVTPHETSVSEPGKTEAEHIAGKPTVNMLRKNKKAEISIPAEPSEMNSYTGTLYEGVSLCPVVSAYKFTGKVDLSTGRGILRDKKSYRIVVSTISCSYLSGVPNIKTVWLKGRTDKEITLAIKRRFKNIVLLKSDGRKFHPEAISHYYPGRGVISDYKGKYFNMVFNDRVELLLFFKDAEEGDRIVIDGAIEAIVKKQP